MLVYAIKWTYKAPTRYGTTVMSGYEKITFTNRKKAIRMAKSLGYGKQAIYTVVLVKLSEIQK